MKIQNRYPTFNGKYLTFGRCKGFIHSPLCGGKVPHSGKSVGIGVEGKDLKKLINILIMADEHNKPVMITMVSGAMRVTSIRMVQGLVFLDSHLEVNFH